MSREGEATQVGQWWLNATPLQIVVYNRGKSSVSHITPLEVTLSCRPGQHDSDRASSARPMYSVIGASSNLGKLVQLSAAKTNAKEKPK